MPFRREIEVPEVFEPENPGFNAIVVNPPFSGEDIVAADIAGYPDRLKQMQQEGHGHSDLVAHLFRRTFTIIRNGGAFGLVATSTISQEDARTAAPARDMQARPQKL